MGLLKVKQIGDFSSAVQNLIDNDADQNAGLIDALEASVDSLETLSGGDTSALQASIDSLEALAAAIQSDVDGNESDADSAIAGVQSDVDTNEANADASIDSLETLAAAIQSDVNTNESDADAAIAALGVRATQLEGDSTYRHQYGTFVSATSFTVSGAVEVAADDDCSVFVNGQAIGRINGLEGDLAYGWSSSNGTSFTLTNIGWNLESSDTIYVVGHS